MALSLHGLFSIPIFNLKLKWKRIGAPKVPFNFQFKIGMENDVFCISISIQFFNFQFLLEN